MDSFNCVLKAGTSGTCQEFLFSHLCICVTAEGPVTCIEVMIIFYCQYYIDNECIFFFYKHTIIIITFEHKTLGAAACCLVKRGSLFQGSRPGKTYQQSAAGSVWFLCLQVMAHRGYQATGSGWRGGIDS